ncbi:hypothetical protein cyc_03915 [Cyclospora cayetanensis]|uniref:Uncharacterized protein n=1 Tax=Cyclospora cayetanensis TaxID=88456 RepID=A0A1D3CVW9_9EIME|nr:hypothetical protein cyc_03915 [Cyclospora cayetanensis]
MALLLLKTDAGSSMRLQRRLKGALPACINHVLPAPPTPKALIGCSDGMQLEWGFPANSESALPLSKPRASGAPSNSLRSFCPHLRLFRALECLSLRDARNLQQHRQQVFSRMGCWRLLNER